MQPAFHSLCKAVSVACAGLQVEVGAVARKTAVPPDEDNNCPQWAMEGECEKNPPFMLNSCATSCADPKNALANSKKLPAKLNQIAPDSHAECGNWAHTGECEKNPNFMNSGCATSCNKRYEGEVPPIGAYRERRGVMMVSARWQLVTSRGASLGSASRQGCALPRVCCERRLR